jgi:hypothetical protein
VVEHPFDELNIGNWSQTVELEVRQRCIARPRLRSTSMTGEWRKSRGSGRGPFSFSGAATTDAPSAVLRFRQDYLYRDLGRSSRRARS